MPGATTARLVVLVFDIPIKLSMISPRRFQTDRQKGAVAPIVARTPIPRVIARPACASMRESKTAARSLTPSGARPSERSASPAAAATKRATGECVCASSFSAARRLLHGQHFEAAPRRALGVPKFNRFRELAACPGDKDAKASPTMTIFTVRRR